MLKWKKLRPGEVKCLSTNNGERVTELSGTSTTLDFPGVFLGMFPGSVTHMLHETWKDPLDVLLPLQGFLLGSWLSQQLKPTRLVPVFTPAASTLLSLVD